MRPYGLVCVAFAAGFGVQAACAEGAQATQGTVTLYGSLDTSIEVTNAGSTWTPRMDSGAYRGSRFGLRGAEPIGATSCIETGWRAVLPESAPPASTRTPIEPTPFWSQPFSNPL